MLRLLFFLFLFSLAGCASALPLYFSDEAWPVDKHETYFRDQAASALYKMKEPSLAEPQITPVYRMLILTGVTPIHAVRVVPKENGTARIITNRLDAGYRIRGRRQHESRKTRLASKEDYMKFKASLENKPLFYENAMPTLEDYHFCMHGSLYIFEIWSQKKTSLIRENFCAQTEEGDAVMQAFYAIANITSEKDSDWSLVDF